MDPSQCKIVPFENYEADKALFKTEWVEAQKKKISKILDGDHEVELNDDLNPSSSTLFNNNHLMWLISEKGGVRLKDSMAQVCKKWGKLLAMGIQGPKWEHDYNDITGGCEEYGVVTIYRGDVMVEQYCLCGRYNSVGNKEIFHLQQVIAQIKDEMRAMSSEWNIF